MKILHVVPFFPPALAWGGPVTTAYEISKELVKRGHQVTVYTTDSLDRYHRVDLPKDRPTNLDGITVYYFKNLSNWLAGKHHIQLTPSIIEVARDKMKGFDIIHLHGYRTPQNIVIYYYARRYNIPYILHAQGTLPNITPKRTLKTIYDLFWGRRLLQNACKVIAMTSTEVEQYIDMGVTENNIVMTPTGIDLDEFADLPPRGIFRRKYNVEENDKLILYLGRIHQSKGIDLIIRAFTDLSKEVDKTKLAIIGPDDGYLSKVKKLIKSLEIKQYIVLLTGPIYGKSRLEAYVDADVFILPRFTSFPKVFVEACACGLPIVATSAGDTLDWLDGRAGLTVPYDRREMQNALLRLLNNDRMRRDLGERGRSLVQEKFNWIKIVDHLEQVYWSAQEV